MTRGLKIATDLKLDEKILISLLVNGLNDNIKMQIILKEPKYLPELSKFIKLCEMTNTMYVNSLEAKFQGIIDEIKDLKNDMRKKQDNVTVNALNPQINDRRYRPSIPFEYQKPRVVNRLTNNPRQQRTYQPQYRFNPCYRCGNNYSPNHRCPAINKQCTFCKRMGHFQKMCLHAKKWRGPVVNKNVCTQNAYSNTSNKNKRAQRALGRSPEEKVKGQGEAIYRGPLMLSTKYW